MYGRRSFRRKSHRKTSKASARRGGGYRKRSARVRSYAKKGFKRYSSTSRRFGKRVRSALSKTGTYNFVTIESDTTAFDQMRPLIGVGTDLGNGFGGFWWAENIGGTNTAAREITSQIPYNAAPAYNLRDNTRSSTRIRLKGIRILGTWHPDPAFAGLADRVWVDMEPHVFIANATTMSYGSQIYPINFIADRKNWSNDENQTIEPPEAWYLFPNVQKGKHAYSVHHSKEGCHRFYSSTIQVGLNAGAVAFTTTGGPLPAVVNNAFGNPPNVGAVGLAHDDSSCCVTWNIPLDHIVEYPRESKQEYGGDASLAIKPVYLAWTGKRSSVLEGLGLAAVQRFGRWSNYHVIVFFEDIAEANF